MSEPLAAALARFDREAARGVVHTGRYRMRYRSWGDGPPLVIVHGMADRARSFALVMARLAARFRCVAYELPNGLDDDARVARYRHADYVADLVALLDHLGVDRADVLGSSFGSTIALAALAAHPGRFRRAVLQGGFARRPLRPAERALALFARHWPGRMGQLPGRRLVVAALDKPAFADAPRDVYKFFVANHGRAPIAAVARRGLTIHGLDLRPALSTVRAPLLMIGGDRDALVPRVYEAEVEAGVAGARRVEIARCGHYPQYTHPDRMAAETAAFLGEPG